MATIHIFVVFAVSCLVSVSGRTLNITELISYFTHGADVGYRVAIDKCTLNLPQQVAKYSFGDVIDNARVYFANNNDWWIHFSTRRYVNGSHFNITGPVSRLTEAFFTDRGEADFNLSDFDGKTGRLLVSGNINCKATQGGVHATTSTNKGKEITTFADVKASLGIGFNVRYHVNILKCNPNPQQFTGTVGWAGRISSHRLNINGDIEFTQYVELPTATFVMDVTLHKDRNVTLYVDSVVPDTRRSTGLLRKKCVLGTAGSFHIFKV
ncbi:hypothetical protein LOTGIDRAFT_156991 [Lottia gigantea]|uniref:Uncharacterized protein n=1 Tax=Lottia gigantea TaxID=225164 RepID=V4BAQ3_LOTGI|nr:hypothetical protein LOTGIDRAFT_156991 [Lottia gigantea]ESP03032.1 hypothetical protein LOTGIDRAFT_156991 [Lottia gigantea]